VEWVFKVELAIGFLFMLTASVVFLVVRERRHSPDRAADKLNDRSRDSRTDWTGGTQAELERKWGPTGTGTGL